MKHKKITRSCWMSDRLIRSFFKNLRCGWASLIFSCLVRISHNLTTFQNIRKAPDQLLFHNIFVLVLEVCTLHAWSQILYCNLHFIQIRFTHVSDLIYVILDKWQCPPSILQLTYFICDSKMQPVSKQSSCTLLNQLSRGYSHTIQKVQTYFLVICIWDICMFPKKFK